MAVAGYNFNTEDEMKQNVNLCRSIPGLRPFGAEIAPLERFPGAPHPFIPSQKDLTDEKKELLSGLLSSPSSSNSASNSF